MGERRYPRYAVGDEVRIVYEPNWDTYVGWDDIMSDYCGEQAVIQSISGPNSRPYYYIDLTDGFVWGDDCFEPIAPDLPDFDASTLDALLSLM